MIRYFLQLKVYARTMTLLSELNRDKVYCMLSNKAFFC